MVVVFWLAALKAFEVSAVIRVSSVALMVKQWEQVPAGAVALAQWLLGEDDGSREAAAAEASGLDEDDFLFEKGELNLWAEPVQWVRLLHRHLCSLVEAFSQVPGGVGPGPELEQQIRTLTSKARAQALSSQQALASLPALPQFSCTVEHSRLLLGHQRASLTLDVLERLRETS
ncbi:unnamed protein product [Tetraodon nigroviridis]|uniref:(spotted green pufferfish) hypothetical protein n=1 Tax=Tetraodon nigroviridis TaxID=99883 RepID=Q4RN42_TETNG|nr:unnamed protein product [Tetraodon nigroviridis]